MADKSNQASKRAPCPTCCLPPPAAGGACPEGWGKHCPYEAHLPAPPSMSLTAEWIARHAGTSTEAAQRLIDDDLEMEGEG